MRFAARYQPHPTAVWLTERTRPGLQSTARSSLVEVFSADNVRGLSEQMSLKYDVDGDGRNDALYITENGTLAAVQSTLI